MCRDRRRAGRRRFIVAGPAKTLAYRHASELFQQTLEEERSADAKLTRLAERFVNPQSIRSTTSA